VHDSSHGLNVTLPFSKSGMMSWLLLFRVFIVHYGLVDTLLGTPCKYSFWGETIIPTKTRHRPVGRGWDDNLGGKLLGQKTVDDGIKAFFNHWVPYGHSPTASLVHCVPQEPFWSSSSLFGSMHSQWLFPPQGTTIENALNKKRLQFTL
jgi:hypothetical protein